MLNKIRMIIFLVVGVPCLLFAAGYAVYQYVAGDGEIVVMAPYDGELTFSIDTDGNTKLQPGTHMSKPAKQGEHSVTLDIGEGSQTRKVKIASGFTKMLVPAPGQCFALFDISKSHYGSAHGMPQIKKRIEAEQPYDLPGSVYYDVRSLPHSIKDNESCNLLVDVPCEVIKGSDAELVKAAALE